METGVMQPGWQGYEGRRSDDSAWHSLTPSFERGQALVVFALALVALVGVLALCTDVGYAYLERRLMQNAADAAAMAGARMLALDEPDTVAATIQEYAVSRNGADEARHAVLGSSVVVTVTKTVPTFFASLIGYPEIAVAARAEAGYTFPGAWEGDLMPMAVHRNAVQPDIEIAIWDSESLPSDIPHGVVADGQRGWLNFNGGAVGESEISNWVINGWDGRVEVGTWINGTPGAKTAALQDIAGVRWHSIVFVPIYDETRPGQNGSGSLDYHIVAFGAFWVEEVKDTGNPKYVKGHFLHYVSTQDMGGTIDTGVRVISLWR